MSTVDAVSATSSNKAELDEEPSEFEDNENVDNKQIKVEPSVKDFQYLPLDHHNPSIRLIRLQTFRSAHGLLQCDIRNASINDKYTCLSYVWGTKPCGSWILLNGHRFWVRRNLFNFLTYARRSPQLTEQWLWIDALCIDQSTTAERNHQVQQMGRIYSEAEEVISWLGCNRKIAELLRSISPHNRKKVPFASYLRAFRNSPYWDRAWITQEIVLARRVIFMARSCMLDGDLIPFYMEQKDKERRDGLRPTILHPRTKDGLRGRSLIYLIDRFRYKHCSDRRDMIFSLTALCGEWSNIQINYSKTPSALAKDVLRACKQSFCLCAVAIVGNVLQLEHLTEKDEQNEPSKEPFARITIAGQRRGPFSGVHYTCLCGTDGCDQTDFFRRHTIHERFLRKPRFAVTVNMWYLCDAYDNCVTFYVDVDFNAIDFELGLDHEYIRRGVELENHHGASAFDQQGCIIHIPFYLLLRMTRTRMFLDRHCVRVSNPGTSPVVDSSALLDFSVLDTEH